MIYLSDHPNHPNFIITFLRNSIITFNINLTMFYRSLYQFSRPLGATFGQKMAALGYLAVGMGFPFLLPLKHSIDNKNSEVPAYGHYDERSAFRI